MHRFLTVFGFALVFSGSGLANPAMTTTDTEMLESPKPHAHVVQAIPAHAQVDVEGCGPVWCSASWRNIPGYVRASSVLPGAAGRFLLDPLPRNNGSPIFLCAGSERIYPVTPEPGP